ncbi:C-glycoside deglycosidase beta subunit domain-containing protein [Kineococcus sp. SYSU DK002]|uniref:C-glycoside deglycosidase beta subunit domain-containing protein n=1 Tax=Kineococcus sp. SYSU DK002 TaxID=3383123 RepID=UPI003D7E0328
MTSALRPDALSSAPGGFAIRLSLPWIRSLPLACLTRLTVEVDGRAVAPRIRRGHRDVGPDELREEPGWWFVQDRVVLHVAGPLTPGPHDVAVTFALVIPYLQGPPTAPLTLPFHDARTLELDAAPTRPTVSLDVA